MELVEEHDLRLVSRWHCHNAPVRFHLHFRPSIEDPLDDMFKAMTFVSSVKERVVYISLEDEGQNKVQITTGDMNACVRRRWFDPTSPPLAAAKFCSRFVNLTGLNLSNCVHLKALPTGAQK